MNVAFRSNRGLFVGADESRGGLLVADRQAVGPSETFEFTGAGPTGSSISLKASNGRYVSAQGGGGGELIANRRAIGAWETFAFSDLPGGNEERKVFLQADNGQYVGIENSAPGLDNDEIATRLDTRREIVSKWRTRFFEQGLPGLEELPRGGRPVVFPP